MPSCAVYLGELVNLHPACAHASSLVCSAEVLDRDVSYFQFDNIDDLVGTDLPVKFLEIEQERDRLVFSARKASNDMKAFNVSLDPNGQ